jgi:hypothetical protein
VRRKEKGDVRRTEKEEGDVGGGDVTHRGLVPVLHRDLEQPLRPAAEPDQRAGPDHVPSRAITSRNIGTWSARKAEECGLRLEERSGWKECDEDMKRGGKRGRDLPIISTAIVQSCATCWYTCKAST